MNQSRLISEAGSLEQNEFWLMFLDESAKLRSARAKMLESVDKEKLTRVQGEISGIDLVLGLPERILRSLQDGSQTKEV
jgi:hypothetical protein